MAWQYTGWLEEWRRVIISTTSQLQCCNVVNACISFHARFAMMQHLLRQMHDMLFTPSVKFPWNSRFKTCPRISRFFREVGWSLPEPIQSFGFYWWRQRMKARPWRHSMGWERVGQLYFLVTQQAVTINNDPATTDKMFPVTAIQKHQPR